jgi:hypothetical protein
MSKVVITYNMLRNLDACSSQQSLFMQTFPDGAVLNKTNINKAIKAGLRISWLAIRVCPPSKKYLADAICDKVKELLNNSYITDGPLSARTKIRMAYQKEMGAFLLSIKDELEFN